MTEADFKELCRAAGELAKAAKLCGMDRFYFTITPVDFVQLRKMAAKYETDLDLQISQPVTLYQMPIKVQW